MSLRLLVLCAVLAPALAAQNPDAPDAYRIVATDARFGAPQTVTIDRDGSRVLVDEVAAKGDRAARHTHSLYDLAAHTRLSWSWPNPAGTCTSEPFSGDWGDPFAASAVFNGTDAKFVGMDTVHGWSANIMDGPAANGGTARAWLEVKTNLLLKAVLTPQNGAPQTAFEIATLDLTPPPESVFVVPPACAAPVAALASPDQQLARLTGGKPDDFASATEPQAPGAGDPSACTVVFRVVRAGSLMPITSGFQAALDLAVDPNHVPEYSIGITPEGYVTFAGGQLHEVTGDFRNGALRIENAPAQFEIDTEFGNGGSGHALVYRHCYAPETVLLFVVKNPARLADGGRWLWVKPGSKGAVVGARPPEESNR